MQCVYLYIKKIYYAYGYPYAYAYIYANAYIYAIAGFFYTKKIGVSSIRSQYKNEEAS